MKLMVSLIAAAGFAATIMTVTPATQVKADEYFIPKGHLYTPKADLSQEAGGPGVLRALPDLH